MSTKRVNPALLPALREALAHAFWFKQDLRAFLTACLGDRHLVAALDWTGYKRNAVAVLLDTLAADQHRYFDDLLNLALATADIADPIHLKSLEDGSRKYATAVEALNTLRSQVEPLRRLRTSQEAAARRIETDRALHAMKRATSEKLSALRDEFFRIAALDAQPRGYALETFLSELFAVSEIDARGPFRIAGEQIDGAFTLEGTEFLVEARWRNGLSDRPELVAFKEKIERKLENTLGLFVSMNGFEQSAIDSQSTRRPLMILMTAMDLVAVLEQRIELPELLKRKRQHAAQTGCVLIEATDILYG